MGQPRRARRSETPAHFRASRVVESRLASTRLLIGQIVVPKRNETAAPRRRSPIANVAVSLTKQA